MNNRVTVADLMRQLSAMPQDARVVLYGSNETYDGFSHPCAVIRTDGVVIVCEQDKPEGWEDSYDEEDPYDVINAMLPAE